MYTKQDKPPVLTWIWHCLDFVAPAAYGEWRIRFVCSLLSPRLQDSSTQKSMVTTNSTGPPGGHFQPPKRGRYPPITQDLGPPALVAPQPIIKWTLPLHFQGSWSQARMALGASLQICSGRGDPPKEGLSCLKASTWL